MNTQQAKQILSKMNFPEQESNELLSIAAVVSIPEGEFFVSEGQVPKKFAIVLNGLFRYFYVSQKGDEFTKGFILSDNILTSYTAMRNESPSLFFIQALEDSVILEVDYKKWLALQKDNSFWDKFLILALEKGYFTKEKRERELLLLDAETRYKIFQEEFPGLDKRAKLQIVASYLGIKPESLSRIRKKLSA